MSIEEINDLLALGVPSRITGHLCQSISPSLNPIIVLTKYFLMFSESFLKATSLMPYIRWIHTIEDYELNNEVYLT
jgi:hypothetical protein